RSGQFRSAPCHKLLTYIGNFAAAVRPHVWPRSYSRSLEIRLKAVCDQSDRCTREMPNPFPETRERDQEMEMNKLLLVAAGAIVLGLTSQASAADLAARHYTTAPTLVSPIYNWSGFYVGINGGGGSSHNCWDFLTPAVLVPPLGPITPEGCHNSTGGTVGGQIGYRWQATNWVFGLEAQGNWADFSGSNTTFLGGNPLGGDNILTTKIDAFGLFTGQVGYAWNNVLAYVKGGAAVVDFKYTNAL